MEKINTELLISLVEARPALWDKTLDTYKDKNLKSSAWREICSLLKENFEDMEQKERQAFGKLILKKWTYIRDSWMKALKKHKDQKTSGTSTKPSRLYIYNEQMSFLKKITDSTVCHENTNNENNTEIEDLDAEVIEESVPPEQPNMEANQSGSTPISTSTARRKRSINEVDAKMMRFIDHQINLSKVSTVKEDENRHLTFFKSILPSLSSFDEDETLEFQSSVLSLLQNMRAKKRRLADNIQMPSRTIATYYNNWQNHDYYSQPQPQTISRVTTPMTSPYTAEPSPSTQSVASQDSILDLDISNF
ncbi:unnamed protein product [Acanthoscelides obtectus]|uniref:MADF domain-containing protein n=1 Tax=Acanthoscelides obtectus TaxID=200917 RepID=A0A9P0NYW7_ACAOB|nr:unnamed protein product [Acanthoscelides obtectus]CAK1657136.1 hypothetical protein AOBTE_LOCUS20141 [Acanthoscelides obtectus]